MESRQEGVAGRPVIVGQGPSSFSEPCDNPYRGRCDEFLAQLAGVESVDRFSSLFELRSLVDHNGVLPRDEAQERAKAMIREFAGTGRRVILLGKRVVHAFDVYGRLVDEPFKWLLFEGFYIALVPRPSDMNPFWNLPLNQVSGLRFFGGVVRDYC